MSSIDPNSSAEQAHIQISSSPTPPNSLNGFTLSSDGKNATKKFTMDGKEFMITITFPLDAKTDHAKGLILEQFKDSHVQTMGKFALQLGLGTKETLSAVEFKQDKEGNLITVKHRTDSSKNKEYNVKGEWAEHYKAKITNLEKDPKIKEDKDKQSQLARARDKLSSIHSVIQLWLEVKTPKELVKREKVKNEREENLIKKQKVKSDQAAKAKAHEAATKVEVKPIIEDLPLTENTDK